MAMWVVHDGHLVYNTRTTALRPSSGKDVDDNIPIRGTKRTLARASPDGAKTVTKRQCKPKHVSITELTGISAVETQDNDNKGCSHENHNSKNTGSSTPNSGRTSSQSNQFTASSIQSIRGPWQKGRQVKILNIVPHTPNADEKALSRFKGSLAVVQSVTEDGKSTVILEEDTTSRIFTVTNAMLFDPQLCMTVKDANADFFRWREAHGNHVALWLYERSQITCPNIRPKTPPYLTSTPEEELWYDSQSSSTLALDPPVQPSSPHEFYASVSHPPHSHSAGTPHRPLSPPQGLAFSQRDINSWPPVRWDFIQVSDSVSAFTNEFLALIRIRIAIMAGVSGIAPESLGSIYPGRNGWLVGYTTDYSMAIVQFQESGNQHQVPFKYICNGPAVKNRERVVVVRDINGQQLVGKHGYFLKFRNLFALGTKDYRAAMIADKLDPSFGTTEKTLVLYKS